MEEETPKLKLVHKRESVRGKGFSTEITTDWTKFSDADPVQDIKDFGAALGADARRGTFRVVRSRVETSDGFPPTTAPGSGYPPSVA